MRVLRGLRIALVAVLVAAGLAAVAAVVSVSGLAGKPAAAGAATPTPTPGGYVAVAPARLLDTRVGNGAPAHALAGHSSLALQITGRGNVPAGAAAIALNVTVTGPTRAGYLTAWPDGITQPTTSNLNFLAAHTVANMVIVPIAADGKVDLYNGSSGTTQVIADVMGYYRSGTPTDPGTLTALTPARVLDTRSGVGVAAGAIAARHTVALTVTNTAGVPASAAAVVLNVTATDATVAGYVTVWGDGTAQPTASNLNYTPGLTVPNLVIAPVGADGKVDLYNGSTGTLHLVADIFGYFLPGTAADDGALHSLTPSRLLDTRGNAAFPRTGVNDYGTVTLPVTGVGGVPASGVAAVVLNVTVTAPGASGYLTVYAGGTAQPFTSNLNYSAAQTVPNLVIAPLGTGGTVALYLGSARAAHVIVDVSGYLLGSPQPAWLAAETKGEADEDLTADSELDDLSCPSTTFCGAVGSYHHPDTGSAGVLATMSGGIWTRSEAPLPVDADPGHYAVMQAISCPAAGSCVAVGYYADDNDDTTQGLIETLTGGTWVASTAPTPGGESSELYSVFCTSSTTCTASGTYEVSTASFPALIVSLSGGSWTATAVPAPPNGDPLVYLNEVSCNGSTCVATGYASADGRTFTTVLETFDGATWTTATPPVPAGGSAVTAISKVVCPATGSCLSGGSYLGHDGKQHGVIESLANGSWTAAAVPADSAGHAVTSLYAVSCPSASFCAFTGNSAQNQPMVVSGTGASWTTTLTPLPIDTVTGAFISSISCGSTTSCTAVGQYVGQGQLARGFVVTLASGGWTAVAATNPTLPPVRSSWTEVVSCAPGSSSCISVGTVSNSSGSTHGLIETYVSGG